MKRNLVSCLTYFHLDLDLDLVQEYLSDGRCVGVWSADGKERHDAPRSMQVVACFYPRGRASH